MMKDPTVGSLVSFDEGLMVTPPKGLEIGYVPIVVKQKAANKSAVDKALAAISLASSNAESMIKAVGDKAAAELKAKQEAEAKAAAELKAKQEADAKAAADKAAVDAKAAAAKAVATKKITITCVKGKLTKKVTAVKPVCPKGYKKK
jgi:hypothetical protein